jgi:hypothetical protein
METKISLYTLINVFMPGFALIGTLIIMFHDSVNAVIDMLNCVNNGYIEFVLGVSTIAISYELGYIVFRSGALFIEPILKKVFGWTEYKAFLQAQKTNKDANDKLDMLSREYGYSRTQIMLFIIISVLLCVKQHWLLLLCSVGIIAVFVLTARSKIIQINKSVEVYNSKSED